MWTAKKDTISIENRLNEALRIIDTSIDDIRDGIDPELTKINDIYTALDEIYDLRKNTFFPCKHIKEALETGNEPLLYAALRKLKSGL